LQRTARGAFKIGAILKPGIGLTAFPIYSAPPLKPKPLGGNASTLYQ